MIYKDISLARSYMDRAYETLEEAKLLFESQMYFGAINRIYYAIYYAVYALVVLKGVYPEKHGGTHHLFNLHYVKSKIVSKDLSVFLKDMYEYRRQGDYEATISFSKEEVETVLDQCVMYVGEIDKLLETLIEQNS